MIGRTTYGKGSVQQVFPLSNQNYLKMTTARWYTPVGRSIQRPYGIGAEGADSVEHDVAPVRTETPSNDTTKKPAYKTDGGRIVYGGGGIYPDIVVVPTRLTTSERALFEALQKNWPKFLDARFRFGVRYVSQHPELQPGFPITPEIAGWLLQGFAGRRDCGRPADLRCRRVLDPDAAGVRNHELEVGTTGSAQASERRVAGSQAGGRFAAPRTDTASRSSPWAMRTTQS